MTRPDDISEVSPMTDTVEVSVRDLALLLISFRSVLEDPRPASRRWRHHCGQDRAAERLADAVEQATGTTDPRMRCKHGHPAYAWPVPAEVRWASVRNLQGKGKLRHLIAPDHAAGAFRALCGLWGETADITKQPVASYRKCGVCVRELGFLGNVTVTGDQ